jgi:serine/threonine protein kinase
MRVGEYVLDEKVGQGAFGEVWSAHHRAWTDQKAAAKIPTDASYLRQLQSEGFSLHRLNHPNIVKVVGFDPSASPP